MKPKNPLVLVFLITFIDLMGFGIVIPLLPLYGKTYNPSPWAFGLLMASYSLMQFLFAPVMGRISDHFGRRPVLLLSLAGTVAGYLLFALQDSLAGLFLSRTVGGVMGANVSTAQAVIADVTGPEERARGMGLVGAAFGLGFILGPAIGGASYRLGPRFPGLFAAGLSGAALLLALLTLPETWTPERRAQAPASRRGWFSLSALRRALAHREVGAILLLFFLATFAFSNFEATFALLLQGRFGLSMAGVAYLFVFLGILAAVVQGGLVGRLARRYGERKLVVAGALLLLPAYAALTRVATLPRLAALLAFLALGAGLTGPSLSSLVSRLSAEDEQGGVLGLYQSMASLARIIGPFWGVFAFERFGQEAPYWTAAATGAGVAARARRLAGGGTAAAAGADPAGEAGVSRPG